MPDLTPGGRDARCSREYKFDMPFAPASGTRGGVGVSRGIVFVS